MASWCETCKLELKELFTVMEELNSNNITTPQIILIAELDTIANMKQFVDSKNISAINDKVFNKDNVLLDSSNTLREKLSLNSIPSTAVFNHNGEVINFTHPITKQSTQIVSGPINWRLDEAKSFLRSLCSLQN